MQWRALCLFWVVWRTCLLWLLRVYHHSNGHIGKSLSNVLKFFQKLAMCMLFQFPVLTSHLYSLLGFCYCFRRQEFVICALRADHLWHPFVRANENSSLKEMKHFRFEEIKDWCRILRLEIRTMSDFCCRYCDERKMWMVTRVWIEP